MHYCAEMARLCNNSNALWIEHFREGEANLLSEPFLDLKLLREYFNYSSNLREANYLVVRNIPNMHLALLASNRLGIGLLIYLPRE